jgi:hypothetical protein
MKIGEARQLYSSVIKSYHEQYSALHKQRQELQNRMDTTPDGKVVFANEAAVLELSIKAVDEKQTEYKEYMEKLMEQWNGVANMEVARQQGDAAEEYAADMSKAMEVARRIMKGGIVPAKDEKKLMEFSMELYQAAKNIGSMVQQKEREKYKSLWKDEEDNDTPQDPMDVADNAEAFAPGPAVVEVSDVMSSVETPEIS